MYKHIYMYVDVYVSTRLSFVISCEKCYSILNLLFKKATVFYLDKFVLACSPLCFVPPMERMRYLCLCPRELAVTYVHIYKCKENNFTA